MTQSKPELAYVSSMLSPRSNRQVANQFIIKAEHGTYFQSYKTIIAYIDKYGKVFLDTDSWNYSVTTGKYRNAFLGENIAQTRDKIAEGVYTLINLN